MKIFINNNELISEYLRLNTNDDVYSLEDISKFNEEKVLIIGNFDSLHKGHLEIINDALNKAKNSNKKSIIYSIINHTEKNGDPLATISEKLSYFSDLGIDYVYLVELKDIINFDSDYFINNILIDKLNISDLFCGFNFYFGKGKKGNVCLLRQYADKNLFELHVKMPYVFKEENNEFVFKSTNNLISQVEEGYIPISSTFIKENIQNFNIEKINELLIKPYKIISEIKMGKQIGRLLGFPTANILTTDKKYPKTGVYGVKVKIEGYDEVFYGVTNIGYNPTLENLHMTVETNIFNFDDTIYGKIIEIEFLKYIRPEQKFNNLDELKNQISNDVNSFKEYIGELNV